MSDETSMSNDTNMPDGKAGLLCADCGETFSSFLQEMADHNAKVTACPKCGKQHEFKPPKATKRAARTRPIRKTISKI